MKGSVYVQTPEHPTWPGEKRFESSDSAALDIAADKYRNQYGQRSTRVIIEMSRQEKTKLTRSVLKRADRRCEKCRSDIDVKVVSLRYQEYHNPDKLVALCRVCRFASWRVKYALRDTIQEDEAALRAWVGNGMTGLEEMLERFLEYIRARSTPEELVRFDADIAAIGKEGMLEMFGSLFEIRLFTGGREMWPKASPWLKAVLARYQDVAVPKAFESDDEDQV